MNLSTLRIAWRNLSRNRRRTALAISAIAIGQFTLVFVSGMMAGMFDDMIDAITGPLVGHVQVHHEEWRDERAVDLCVHGIDDAVQRIERMSDVQAALPRIYSPALTASGEQSNEPAQAEVAVVVGIRFDAEMKHGGLLEDLNAEEFGGGAVLGSVLATRLGVHEGELLAVISQDADEFPVTELVEIGAIINSPVELVKTMGILIPLEEAQALFALTDQAHELIILGTDYQNADLLAAEVSALPALADAEVLTWQQATPDLARMIEFKGWIDFVFVGILFIAAAAGIANTAMMSTFERLREFGMLLALGTKPQRIVVMVLVESVLLGVVGVVVGSVLGTIVVLITSRTGIDYAGFAGSEAQDVSFAGLNISYMMYPVFRLRSIVFGFIAVSLTSILASTWPAMFAARLEPVRALRS